MRMLSLCARALRRSTQSLGIALGTLGCAGAPETKAQPPVGTTDTASAEAAAAAPRAGAGPRGGAPQTRATLEAPPPPGFRRLAQLPQGRIASVFTLTGTTAIIVQQFGDSPEVGTPRAVWISGDQVEDDPERFRGLGNMGWVKLDTRGRKYPIKSEEADAGLYSLSGAAPKLPSNDERFGTRSITALAGDPKQRLLAVVTWAASPEQQTSALYEWRSETNAWTKLRDTADQAVIGVNDEAVVALEQGAVVVELETAYTLHMPRTWRLRAVGHAAALPKLEFMKSAEGCLPDLGGIILVSSQVVAWGQGCAAEGGVLEWFAPPNRQSQRQKLSEAFHYMNGSVTLVGSALVVRPNGDTGYRLSYAGGRWVRDDATPVVAFGAVREKFEQAGLAFADAYDAPDGGLLVLSLCHARTTRLEDVPTCAYRATAATPSAGAPAAPAATPSAGVPAAPAAPAAPARPMAPPKGGDK